MYFESSQLNTDSSADEFRYCTALYAKLFFSLSRPKRVSKSPPAVAAIKFANGTKAAGDGKINPVLSFYSVRNKNEEWKIPAVPGTGIFLGNKSKCGERERKCHQRRRFSQVFIQEAYSSY